MSKIITHEIYLERIKSKQLKIEPVENYINAKTPIMHRCLKHNIIWKISPSNVLKGKGCSICKSEKIKNRFLKTNEEYIKELAEKNPYLKVLEDYVDTKTPILHKCIKHGVKWKITPSNALKGCGCCKCKSDKIIKHNLKTHEEYIQELNNTKPHISVIERYIDGDTPILHHCVIHNVDYKCAPNNALNNYGCPQCSSEHFRKTIAFSHEKYLSLLSIKNPNIKPLEKYIDSKTKILHYCEKHNYKWNASPTSILSGHGCYKCKVEKISEKNKFTNRQYNNLLKEKSLPYVPIEEYINMKTPIMHECILHNVKWRAKPKYILGKYSECKECKKKNDINKNLKIHQQYIEKLKNKNPNLQVLENYKGISLPIKHCCIKHNIIWNIKPFSALQNYGCEYCRREKIGNYFRKNHKQYLKDVNQINLNIEVIGQYVNATTAITHYCKKHNEYWDATPNLILSGHCGCKKCHNEKIREALIKTNAEYINDVKKINPFISVEETYIDAKTPILHKCLLDDFLWYAKPNNILSGKGCPNCSQSKGEFKITSWLFQNDILYKEQFVFEGCRDKKELPFDFYLPNYNIIIEYDGEQHFRPIEYFGGEEKFKIQQKHDEIKNKFCKDNGITLLRIPYFDYDAIEEILDNFLFN